jgi:hypothetical protein
MTKRVIGHCPLHKRLKHDLILGILWQKANRVNVDWVGWTLLVGTDKVFLKARPTPLTPEILMVEYEQALQEEGAEGFAVFIHEILAEFKPEEITPKIRALLNEFKDRFPDLKPGVKFVNLLSNSTPNQGEFNHSIPLIDSGIRPYYQHS